MPIPNVAASLLYQGKLPWEYRLVSAIYLYTFHYVDVHQSLMLISWRVLSHVFGCQNGVIFLRKLSKGPATTTCSMPLQQNGCMCITGGAFVVQLPDCLTTFTVSMVYLLMRSFTGLSLVKPFTSCAATGGRFLVCLGRLDDGNVGALWLTEVTQQALAENIWDTAFTLNPN